MKKEIIIMFFELNHGCSRINGDLSISSICLFIFIVLIELFSPKDLAFDSL